MNDFFEDGMPVWLFYDDVGAMRFYETFGFEVVDTGSVGFIFEKKFT